MRSADQFHLEADSLLVLVTQSSLVHHPSHLPLLSDGHQKSEHQESYNSNQPVYQLTMPSCNCQALDFGLLDDPGTWSLFLFSLVGMIVVQKEAVPPENSLQDKGCLNRWGSVSLCAAGDFLSQSRRWAMCS